ncbi:cysteine hydrolase [Roseburia sp. MUC/MUC-530-WT-4D]|uniref:Cysteine hydrolase n=1 Tax=Roseburia porci TaxID=2605790 RepID=A0A6L5YU74_9FIRM|nr:isochorismatase family cysteine hydrolase [Roseburia porci]MST75261.1 cysteine hydrolase [Roseburia porci]
MSKRYWEWKSSFPVKAEDAAFLIIDMQKGFVDEGGCLEVPMAREQLPVMVDFMEFCHENKISVYKSVFAQGPDFSYDFYWNKNKERGLMDENGDYRFAIGSEECEMTGALDSGAQDIVFPKYGYDCFAYTKLDQWLKKENKKTLIICGTVVNWCVDSTVRSAYHKGYQVVVLADAVSGYDHAGLTGRQWVETELDLFGEAFAKVESARQLEQEISDNRK